jgi:hypothetical protein
LVSRAVHPGAAHGERASEYDGLVRADVTHLGRASASPPSRRMEAMNWAISAVEPFLLP